jgi:protein FRG1
MVSALRFKGEKKPKKRKRTTVEDGDDAGEGSSQALTKQKAPRTGDEEEEGWVDSEVIGWYSQRLSRCSINLVC